MNQPEASPLAESIAAAFALESARRAEFWAAPSCQLFDRDTQAAVLYVKRQTIELAAIRGDGVPYRRIGRRALSTKGEILDWMAAQGRVVTNTAQAAQVAA